METHWNWCGRAMAVVSLGLFTFAPALAEDPATGVLWETTAQASIPGMPVQMPAYTAQYCSKEEWTQPPQTSQDSSQNCRHTSFEQTPTKVTWTMTCDNPPMTGNGEITFNGTDSYSGFVNMQAEQMNMVINLSGNKIGTCDNPQ